MELRQEPKSRHIVSTARMSKGAPVPIPAQISILAKYYPNGVVKTQTLRRLVWECDIIPTPNSVTYRIRIDYTINQKPNVYVIEPPVLDRPEGAEMLKHVYSTEKQQICLYYGPFGEWDSTMFLAQKIVPWAAEWLLFYELWVITGEWLGEGIEHSRQTPFRKANSTEKNDQ